MGTTVKMPIPDKILTVESFIEIIEAVDLKLKNEPNNDKLLKIQGALYEILTRAHEFETLHKKPDQLFPYETFIEMTVITGQLSRLSWTDEDLKKIV